MEEYYVVLFDEYTSMLPKSWLNFEKETLQWPPGPVSKLSMSHMIPNAKWTEYKYKKVLGPYDFAKACRIEQESLQMSTGDESDKMTSPVKPLNEKRVRKKPLKFTPNESSSTEGEKSFEDDDSDKDDENTHSFKFPSPKRPKIAILPEEMKKSQLTQDKNEPLQMLSTTNIRNNIREEDNLNECVENDGHQKENSSVKARVSFKKTTDSKKTKNTKRKDLKSKSDNNEGFTDNSLSPSGSNTSNTPINFDDAENNRNQIKDNAADAEVSDDSGLDQIEAATSNKGNSSGASKKSSYHKGSTKCAKKNEIQYATVEDLKNMHKKIVKFTKHQELLEEVANDDEYDIESQLNLPLSTVDELKKFNLLLENDANTRNKFKLMITKIDGTTQASFVYKSLERVMTNELALLYSYSGQSRGKNKEHKTLCFKNLKLYDMLKRIIVYSKHSYTEAEYNRCVKRWLNYAKQRIDQAKAKDQHLDSEEE